MINMCTDLYKLPNRTNIKADTVSKQYKFIHNGYLSDRSNLMENSFY